MKTISLICFAVCVALASAKSVYEPRIVGGDDAVEGQFPYQGRISLNDFLWILCFQFFEIQSNTQFVAFDFQFHFEEKSSIHTFAVLLF